MIKNVILDTDVGYDADDAFALGLTLKSPEISLNLIITNDEFQGKRVQVLSKFLTESNYFNIPIAKGLDLGNKHFIAEGFIEDYKTGEYKEDFVGAIKEVVEKNDKTYYVCIGTFSNLAKFILVYPDLTKKIELLCLAGSKKNTKPEHNLRLDIDSARKVIESKIPINVVTADITRNKQIELTRGSDIIHKLGKSKEKLHQCIYQLTKLWFDKKMPKTYMHDPLTLSYLINPKFLTFKKEKITFTSDGHYTTSEGVDVNLCIKADYAGFMRFFQERIFK